MAIDLSRATYPQHAQHGRQARQAQQTQPAQYPTYRTAIETTLRGVLGEIRCTGSMSQASLDWVTTVAPYLGRERLVEIQTALKAASAAPARPAFGAFSGRAVYPQGGAILSRASLL